MLYRAAGQPDDGREISSRDIKPLVASEVTFEIAQSTFTRARRDTFPQLAAIIWEPTDRGFKRIEINWDS